MSGGTPGIADAAGGVTRLPVLRPVPPRSSWVRLARLGRFGLVGMSGFVVNEVALALFVSAFGVNYLVGAILATQLSSLWNFALVELWAFRHHEARRPMHHRLGLFLAVNNVALILRGPILFALTTGLGVNYLFSNLVSLGVLTVVRFAIADSWIWGAASVETIDEPPPPPGPLVRSGSIRDVASTSTPEPSVPRRAPTRFVRVSSAARYRRRRSPASEPGTPVGDDAA